MLEISDLTVHYGRVLALADVTLSVQAGEIVALLGANGSGKSTLVNTVSGLMAPTCGRIRFMEEELAGRRPEAVARQGLIQVPEGRQLFPALTIEENLRMGAYLVRNAAQVSRSLEEVFALFPILKERSGQLGGTLSGGEQQMLAIARGLMAEPKVLLLDEPSLGLAPLLAKAIFRTLEQINKAGVTIVLVEQNARAALKLANRGYIMEVGNIVLEDSAAALLTNPEVQKAYLGG
jgi:branched-chain amino acid transport system ATP-binding protein